MGQFETMRMKLEPLINSLEKNVKELQMQINNDHDPPKYIVSEHKRTTERLVFLRDQWADAEKTGTLDEPIYEQGSIEYYRRSLEKNKEYLDVITIQKTLNVLDSNGLKPHQKIKRLKNLMEVYKEFSPGDF